MTDKQYALLIYHNVFGYAADPEDANIRGIEAVLNELSDRERIVLESRLRHEKTFECVGQDIKACKVTAGRLLTKTIVKLRHPSRAKHMKISLLEKDRDVYRELYNDALNTIYDLKVQAAQLAYRMPVGENFKPAFAKFEISIMEIDFPANIKNALLRAGKGSVESILAIPTFEKILDIDRIGSRFAIDIIKIMRDLGFREWSDNMIAGARDYDASLVTALANGGAGNA